MPKTIPLVSELRISAISKDAVSVGGVVYNRAAVNSWTILHWLTEFNTHWFTEECRSKILAAMDDFGKPEEPKHWRRIVKWEPVDAAVGDAAKCLFDLRARIEALEGKK